MHCEDGAVGEARGLGLLPMTTHFQTASDPMNQQTSAPKVDECMLLIVHCPLLSTQ
ncbi:hypothetical protein QVE09_26320 [Paenibacillus sp. ClWae2A]|uniref:hypothetical protein n=1 Tax=Paenibacillus sp. ClWae2A TaxID=3057177 RepID=UPI0028F6BD0F|nr:hypothetical protein [Paenibacillus sp. ClWae2A]MDT9722423.1 hypothetical protein [Paenibacillus sp. ClWae2A]